jgi:hypothetical protein
MTQLALEGRWIWSLDRTNSIGVTTGSATQEHQSLFDWRCGYVHYSTGVGAYITVPVLLTMCSFFVTSQLDSDLVGRRQSWLDYPGPCQRLGRIRNNSMNKTYQSRLFEVERDQELSREWLPMEESLATYLHSLNLSGARLLNIGGGCLSWYG